MRRRLSVPDTNKSHPVENTWLFRVLVKAMRPLFERVRAWERRATFRQKKKALVIFCLCSVVLLGLSFFHGLRKSIFFKQTKVPVMLLPPAVNLKGEKAGHFKDLLDSIRAAPGGAAVLDSVERARPGLLDTLRQLQNDK